MPWRIFGCRYQRLPQTIVDILGRGTHLHGSVSSLNQKAKSTLDTHERASNNTCLLKCVFIVVVRVVSGDILSQRSDHYHCQNTRQKEHNHQWVDDAEPVNLHITHSQVSIPSTGPAQRRFLEFNWVREIQLVAGIGMNLQFKSRKFISNSIDRCDGDLTAWGLGASGKLHVSPSNLISSRSTDIVSTSNPTTRYLSLKHKIRKINLGRVSMASGKPDPNGIYLVCMWYDRINFKWLFMKTLSFSTIPKRYPCSNCVSLVSG